MSNWKDTVNYAGYVVSDAGDWADPSKMKAIGNFPVPKNITDLRSFMGLVNQLGCFHRTSARLLILCED